jgi:hypothetical protein
MANAFQNKKGNSRCPFSGGRPTGTFSATNLHAETERERHRGTIPLSLKPQTKRIVTVRLADNSPLSF